MLHRGSAMADVVDAAIRARMMSGIKSANTAPEMMLRQGLHRRGFRYRLNDRSLPGRPDLVFPKYRAVLFAHGCFWHAHECDLFKWPATRAEFWRTKIHGNRARDARQAAALRALGWRVGCVWECALKGRDRLALEVVLDRCADFFRSDHPGLEICGDARET